MSVLVKGMKMPKGESLKVAIRDGIASVYLDEGKADYYGIIELPDHGDLIDREALMFDAEERYCTGCDSYRGLRCRACWVDDMHGELVDAPVVIPAERSEDGETKQISAEFAKLMREGEIKVRWSEDESSKF